jgi:YbgC/YbaW family acyl-CoA thioester hydrolase
MPLSFSILRRIQFAETDMAGIAHFSNFFRMMEEVEHAFFRSVGLSVAMQHDGMHVGWPRVSTSCEFFGPVRFEDEMELSLRVVRLGEKSFSYEVDFLLGGKRMALGKTTSVCCELRPDGTMKSIPIPQTLRERLDPGVGANTVV